MRADLHNVHAAPRSQWGSVEKRAAILLTGFTFRLRTSPGAIVGGHRRRSYLPAGTDGHAVFVGEISWVDLVAVGDHCFVCNLLFGGIVDGVVPLKAKAGHGEPVEDHARDELVVDYVTEHVAVGLHKIKEYPEVGLRLGERGAVLDSHGLADDEFGELGVGAVDAFVIDIESVTFSGLDELDLGVGSGDDTLVGTGVVNHVLDTPELLGVAGGGACNAPGHTENFGKTVPEGHGMLFGNGVEGSLEEQTEVVGASGLDEPVGIRLFAIRNTGGGGCTEAGDDDTFLGNDMPSGNKIDRGESGAAVVVGYDVAELDERVTVPDGLEAEPAKVLEPSPVEELGGVSVGDTVGVDKFERARHDEPHALLDTAGEVGVNHGVAVNVVELASVGVAGVNGLLPCMAPDTDVVFDE